MPVKSSKNAEFRFLTFSITFCIVCPSTVKTHKLPQKVQKIENVCNLICNLKRVRNLKVAPNIVSKIHLNHYI